MMNSISGLSSNGPMQRPQGVSLTEDQKTQAQEIVSKYDSESMTAESKKEMLVELEEAGIGKGKDLGDILKGEGFEVKGPGGKGPKGGGPPPPPPAEAEQSEEIAAFVKKYESGEISSEDIDDLMDLLRDQGESGSGVLMDEEA